jgi:hypothetical protein
MIQFLEIGSTVSTHTSCIAHTIFLELDAPPSQQKQDVLHECEIDMYSL